MNKLVRIIIKNMLPLMLMLSITTVVFAADIPTDSTISFRGNITSVTNEIVDGAEIDVKYDVILDTVWDYFDLSVNTITYDSEIFEIISASFTGYDSYAASLYHVTDGVTRVTILNPDNIATSYYGIVGKVNLVLRVKDAAKLVDETESILDIALYANMLRLGKDGESIRLEDAIAENPDFNIEVDCEPMKVKINQTSPVDPPIDEPTIELTELAENIEIQKGRGYQFTTTVTGGTKNSVVWIIEGATSLNTVIDDDGYLFISIDETSDCIVVTATSTEDPTKSVSTDAWVIDALIPPIADPATPKIPNTGVNENVIAWVGMLAVSAGISSLVVKKKKDEVE